MTSRVIPLAVLAVFALCSDGGPGARLSAYPVEALPDREWTNQSGSRLLARLTGYPDGWGHGTSVLLVPAELSRPPLAVPITQLSAADQAYIKGIRSPYPLAADWRDLREASFTYADGETIPGRLESVNTFRRELWFKSREDERFILSLDSLSHDSAERIRAAYLLQPQMETLLADLYPLDPSPVLPARVDLKNVLLEKQEGSYCVPASAAMVADYHGVNITQKQIAHLSSTDSRQHRGTWSADMKDAMGALGFHSETRLWHDTGAKTDYARFTREILPFIRQSLLKDGPLYVSFKAGVYGSGGHGCVIVGYNDAGDGTLEIHNPWGTRERYRYRDFSLKAHEAVRFHLPPPVKGDSAALEAKALAALRRSPVDVTDAMRLLKNAGLRPVLRFHARNDRRDDRNEVLRWSLAQGPRIIAATLDRHQGCLIPIARENGIVGWHFLRLDPGNPAPLVRSRSAQGWTEASRPPLDTLLNSWSVPLNVLGAFAWDMPLIELDA